MTPISSAGRLSRAVNIEDLRELARRRLPRIVFNYIDGGADSEWTLRENRRAFDAITFRPHQAVAVPECDLRTRVLGTELSMPLLLAPVGYMRVMHPDGEIAAARAAGRAGVGFILSTVSGHRLENVKAASSGKVWYQLSHGRPCRCRECNGASYGCGIQGPGDNDRFDRHRTPRARVA